MRGSAVLDAVRIAPAGYRKRVKRGAYLISIATALGCVSPSVMADEPPYAGTVFISPNVIRPSDPTSFVGAKYKGQGQRTVFDRRVNDWITVNAYLFNVTFSDGTVVEGIANPEYESPTLAKRQVVKFGRMIGRLPAYLRGSVDALWLHKGDQPWGGGNRSLLIHTDSSVDPGYFEETLFHEAAHTSVDAQVYGTPEWNSSVAADPNYISTYARDNPDREDVAESLLPWFAVRERSHRISAENVQTILTTIPHRIAYFDTLLR